MPPDPNDNVFGRLARPRRELTTPAPAQATLAPERPAPERPAPKERPPDAPKQPGRKGASAGKKAKRSKATPGDPTNYVGGGLYEHKGKKTKKLVAYVDPALHQSVKVGAAERGVTMSELVESVMGAAGFGRPTGEPEA